MTREYIINIVSDAIAVGYDSFAELLGFCKGLELCGRPSLAEDLMHLYTTRASCDEIHDFVTKSFSNLPC